MKVACRFRSSRQTRKLLPSVISLKPNWPFYCHLLMLQEYLCWLLIHCPNTWVLQKAHVNASTQLPKRSGRLSHCVCWLGWSGLRSSRRPAVFPPVFSWKLSPSCLLGHIIPCRYQFSGRTPGPTASQVLGWVGTPAIPQSNSGAHAIQTTALGIAKWWPQSLSLLTHILTGIPL